MESMDLESKTAPRDTLLRDIVAGHPELKLQGVKLKIIPQSNIELVASCYDPSDGAALFHPVQIGGYANIFKGMMMPGSTPAVLVAVKVFRKGHIDIEGDEEKLKYINRLRREYAVWGMLSHPNILPLEGLVDHPKLSSAGLVSRFISLGDLADFMASGRKFDRLFMVRGITSGLAYLHSMNVVHCDLALRNILVEEGARGDSNPSFNPLITDFGKSRVLEEDGYTTNAGKPPLSYQAPEVLSDTSSRRTTTKDVYTTTSDVYSLSLVVLQILTGKEPFSMEGLSDIAAAFAIVQKQLRPTPEKYPFINDSDSFCWSIMEACWKDLPADRISSEEALRLLYATDPPVPRFN